MARRSESEAGSTETGYPARFVANEQNLGICAVRNRALELATGRYVCSLSGDDFYELDRLERQVEFFDTLDDDVAFVYSDVRCCDAGGRPLPLTFLERTLGTGYVAPEDDVFERTIVKNFIAAPGVIIRRSAIDAVGAYDETLFFEDVSMWLSLSHRFRVRHLAGVVCNYRQLTTSMAHSPRWRHAMERDLLRLAASWLGHDRVPTTAMVGEIRRKAALLALDGEVDVAGEILAAAQRAAPSWAWRVLTPAVQRSVPLAALRTVRAAHRVWFAVRHRRQHRRLRSA